MSSVNFIKTILKLCPKYIDRICMQKYFCNTKKFNINETMYYYYCNNLSLNFNEKKNFNNNNNSCRQSRINKNTYFLFGGIYTLFGLFKEKEDKEEDPEYITAMKRSILAMQV